MVLQNKEYGLEDFLKDVNFICPQGFNIKYILIPDTNGLDIKNLDLLSNSGYDIDSVPSEQNKSKNIYYAKKDLKSTHSFSKSNLDTYTLNPMPKQVNNEVELVDSDNQDDINSLNPFMGSAVKPIQVVENSKRNFKFILKENIAGLPKNTLFNLCR